jgi:hypothetical protein
MPDLFQPYDKCETLELHLTTQISTPDKKKLIEARKAKRAIRREKKHAAVSSYVSKSWLNEGPELCTLNVLPQDTHLTEYSGTQMTGYLPSARPNHITENNK